MTTAALVLLPKIIDAEDYQNQYEVLVGELDSVNSTIAKLEKEFVSMDSDISPIMSQLNLHLASLRHEYSTLVDADVGYCGECIGDVDKSKGLSEENSTSSSSASSRSRSNMLFKRISMLTHPDRTGSSARHRDMFELACKLRRANDYVGLQHLLDDLITTAGRTTVNALLERISGLRIELKNKKLKLNALMDSSQYLLYTLWTAGNKQVVINVVRQNLVSKIVEVQNKINRYYSREKGK